MLKIPELQNITAEVGAAEPSTDTTYDGSSKPLMQFSDWLIIEQFLIVAAIHIGVHSNPMGWKQELSFAGMLIISYSFIWIAPIVFEKAYSSSN